MIPAVLSIALVLCSPAGRPILAEVFYDASGDDTGREFVELLNPTATALPLAGLRLEAGDGSGPGRWTLRWTGQAEDSVAAGARFVIGGAQVTPPPQAVVSLDLQNGPDAVRLVWPDGAIEVVGYGPLEFPEYACTAPAEDVPSGFSLGRVPDDSDRGSNALDFIRSDPSPGRPNRPDTDLAWVAGSLALDPEQPEAGGGASLTGRVWNRGRDALGPGATRVVVSARGSFGERWLADHAIEPALPPGDSAALAVPLAGLAEGKQTLRARLELEGDEAPENDLDSLRVQVGPGPFEITEIQFHPAGGEGEWVEIGNRSGAPLDPAAFTLSDRGSGRGHPAAGAGPCPPESLVLLAQDRAALLARYPRLDPLRVWQVSPWGSLNNSDDATGIADAVVLREADGTLCARQEYSAAGVPAGVPLERREGAWLPALDPDGTPLAPARVPAALLGRLEIRPRRLRPGAETARLGWSLPWSRGRVSADLYDLSGGRVARVLPEIAVAGRGEREWRIAGIPAGLYVMVMRARQEGGSQSLHASGLVRIEGLAR